MRINTRIAYYADPDRSTFSIRVLRTSHLCNEHFEKMLNRTHDLDKDEIRVCRNYASRYEDNPWITEHLRKHLYETSGDSLEKLFEQALKAAKSKKKKPRKSSSKS